MKTVGRLEAGLGRWTHANELENDDGHNDLCSDI